MFLLISSLKLHTFSGKKKERNTFAYYYVVYSNNKGNLFKDKPINNNSYLIHKTIKMFLHPTSIPLYFLPEKYNTNIIHMIYSTSISLLLLYYVLLVPLNRNILSYSCCAFFWHKRRIIKALFIF